MNIIPKEHLSYSQISSYQFCPRKYYFQTIEGISPVSVSLVAGKAAHHALEVFYWYKRRYNNNKYLTSHQVARIFKKRFKRNVDTIEDWAGLNEELVIKYISTMLRAHVENIAVTIDPDEIELDFKVNVDGVDIVGVIDLISNGEVWDHKFRLSTKRHYYKTKDSLQLYLYSYVTGISKVRYIIHTLKKNDDGSIGINIQVLKHTVDPKEAERVVKENISTVVKSIERDIRRGYFGKGRVCKSKDGSWICPFYHKCWNESEKTEAQMYSKLRRLINKIHNRENKKALDELFPYDPADLDNYVLDSIPF